MTVSHANESPWLWVWGKTDQNESNRRQGGPAWDPLLAHVLDTAACAGQLWDRYLPPTARERLARALGANDEPTARRLLMLLAGLHDLGKGCNCFLRQFGSGTRDDTYLKRARTAWERNARASGLPLADDLQAQPYARHEHVTAAHLPRLLGCTCSECGGEGAYHEGLHTAAALLGGHHGHIPNVDTIRRAAIAAPITEWEPVYRAVVDTAAGLIGVDLAALKALNLEHPAAMVLMAGTVVLADWIASDEQHFTYRRFHRPIQQWWHDSQRQAEQAVTALRLDAWVPRRAAWEELWPDTAPRPIQSATMAALQGSDGPALVVIESDTGSGKTRLALWCAHHLARTCGYQGLYMAMPTRAATNQIATELRTFIDAALGDREAANLAVVHATAEATSIVHQLLDASQHPGANRLHPLADAADSTLLTDQAPQAGRAVLDPWYLKRCLGLVATFGIGTIDQVLLATQPSRYWFLRMLGIAVKTVIIDEAHAYELYQQDLLSTAIEWLADAGASVVVLSATLPADVRQALTNAWCRGHRTSPSDQGQTGPITIVDRQGNIHRTAPEEAATPLRSRWNLLPEPGPTALADQLLAEAKDGGIIAVVRNRVASANALHAAALSAAASHGWRPQEIILLHGRQMPRDRLPVEERLTRLLGPLPGAPLKRNPDRPARLLVIATQVIEQSIDIDFDRLYSDLAPIDLLIQRRGRLHRHAINDPGRLETFARPAMTVLWQPTPGSDAPLVEPPDPDNGRPTGNRDGAVYAPYTLAATWFALIQRAQPDGSLVITAPHDSGPLLHAVYGPLAAVDGDLGNLLRRTWRAWRYDLSNEHETADHRVFRPYLGNRAAPTDVNALASGKAHGDGDDEDAVGLAGIRAASRYGEPSVNVIALYLQRDGPQSTLSYDAAGQCPADLRSYPPQSRQRLTQQSDLLLNTIPIPASWFTGYHALPKPSSWPGFARGPLRRRNVALFDPDSGACIQGPVGIRYTSTSGLTR